MVHVHSLAVGLVFPLLWNAVTAVPIANSNTAVDERAFGELEDRDESFITNHTRSDLDEDDSYTELARRATGTQTDPYPITVDVTGWQNIAEMNCYLMLCKYSGQRVWQRNPGSSTASTHRTASGANLTPFAAAKLATYSTKQITTSTTSAEEFPWASMNQGGTGAHLMPATIAEQNVQKNAISAGYSRTPTVPWSDWFELTFTNYLTTGVYCPALFKTTPDTSVCSAKTKTTLFGTSVYPGDYDYVRQATGAGKTAVFKLQ
ncbi:hypothetical protein BX600DRAFT_519813 [Xylariales sp. PMI_506]|nr:hypothetical protein BX600DRAFT_519813 [Xylariales sp. PMI_506]